MTLLSYNIPILLQILDYLGLVRTAIRAVVARFAALAAFEQTLPFAAPSARLVNQTVIDQV